MATHSGRSISIWMATSEVPRRPALAAGLRVDVCIVGAGIAGLTAAYLLTGEGRSVVVLDDGPPGGGMTERTTAHLSNAVDDRYTRIERLHGRRGARIAAESHTAAIDRIETIARRERIDCSFERVDGWLFRGAGTAGDVLDRELDAAHRAGLTAVERCARAPIETIDTGPALRFPRQAQFHPLRYLAGLARSVERAGGRICSDTHVTSVSGGPPGVVETSNGYTVGADDIIIATNTPINDRFAIHTKQAPYTTYVIGLRIAAASVAHALFWDMEDPYHYVRLADDGAGHEVLIVGGEDHKTGQADDGGERYARLQSWASERFPKIEALDYRWSGQVMEPVDGVAFIGRNPGDARNVCVATGDSGMGMTHGTIAGMLLTDLILGRDNPWAALYDPSRKSARALLTYAKENLNVAARATKDYLSGGDVGSVSEIVPDSGAIVRRGLAKIAVYRDPKGTLHERSALCPHLGCIVAWNAAERSWDCPCHGSRFDRFGQVITGPANRDLGLPEE